MPPTTDVAQAGQFSMAQAQSRPEPRVVAGVDEPSMSQEEWRRSQERGGAGNEPDHGTGAA